MKKIELKAKKYAGIYIKNNFNGAKTMKELNPGMSDDVAKSGASETLANPYYQRAIVEKMEEIKLDDTLINKITKRNIKQKKSIPASNQAMDMYHKIKGNYAPEKKLVATVNLTGKALDEAIEAKLKELKAL